MLLAFLSRFKANYLEKCVAKAQGTQTLYINKNKCTFYLPVFLCPFESFLRHCLHGRGFICNRIGFDAVTPFVYTAPVEFVI